MKKPLRGKRLSESIFDTVKLLLGRDANLASDAIGDRSLHGSALLRSLGLEGRLLDYLKRFLELNVLNWRSRLRRRHLRLLLGLILSVVVIVAVGQNYFRFNRAVDLHRRVHGFFHESLAGGRRVLRGRDQQRALV